MKNSFEKKGLIVLCWFRTLNPTILLLYACKRTQTRCRLHRIRGIGERLGGSGGGGGAGELKGAEGGDILQDLLTAPDSSLVVFILPRSESN